MEDSCCRHAALKCSAVPCAVDLGTRLFAVNIAVRSVYGNDNSALKGI